MRGLKVRLTIEQEMWLKAHFSDTSNAECAAYCGCGWRTIVRKARAMGLVKSREFMEKSWRKGVETMRILNNGEGNQGKVNLLKYGVPYRFKKGENYKNRCTEEQWAEMLRKAREARNETIRRDRIRIKWGFEQKTKLRLVQQPRQWRTYRYTMGKRGYIVERGSRVIFYDENTNRSAVVEKNAQAAGLIILQADGLQYKTT